jgi:lysylphosphatidylglycerol synthetase-like protein (DUF2156 family)
MTSSFEPFDLLKGILLLIFLFIYVLAFVIVKPFILNYKRLISTLSLKITYLIYVFCLLVCTYLFIFFGSKDIGHKLNELVFFSLLICFFIPNLGILFRRKFEVYRDVYNYVFSAINILVTILIIFKLNQLHWFIF